VRLSVNPQPMFTMNQPQMLRPEYLDYLDTAVKMILDHGLVVVIDMHPESDFKQRLTKDDTFVSSPISGARWHNTIRPGIPTESSSKS